MVRFDELNQLGGETYEEYYDVMAIPDSAKKKRKELAEKLDDDFLYFLDLLMLFRAMEISYETFRDAVTEEYTQAIDGIETSPYFEDHISEFAKNLADSKEDDYSVERAVNMAKNEANAVWNDAEFWEAVMDGKKTKIWRTMLDNRVRETHAEMEGVELPISEPFDVNGSRMMFPKDTSLGASAEEIVGCRCSLSYA